MISTFGLGRLPNSSPTSPKAAACATALPRNSEEFSVVMKAKQEAGRVRFAGQVAELGPTPTMSASGAAAGTEKSSGSWVSAGPPAPAPEEFQRGEHDSVREDVRSEAPSPWFDPLQRVLVHSTPPEPLAPAPAQPTPSLDELWKGVRRVAFGGDRRRSVAYIELGAGALSGAALTVEARGETISLVLELPPGVGGVGWAERLTDRLTRRGLEVQNIEVR